MSMKIGMRKATIPSNTPLKFHWDYPFYEEMLTLARRISGFLPTPATPKCTVEQFENYYIYFETAAHIFMQNYLKTGDTICF